VNEPAALAVQLAELRATLGLSLHAMAELLYTSQQTYRGWEAGAQPRKEGRARIERFIESAHAQLDHLEEGGWNLTGLIPLSVASSTLGVPHETLFHAYRDSKYQAFDLGILGIWVRSAELDNILEAVLA
jgi:transcriptional regulator with XRE-family HTH domain